MFTIKILFALHISYRTVIREILHTLSLTVSTEGGSFSGGKQTTTLLSMTTTCKLCKINLQEHLKSILMRIAIHTEDVDVSDLTPQMWIMEKITIYFRIKNTLPVKKLKFCILLLIIQNWLAKQLRNKYY